MAPSSSGAVDSAAVSHTATGAPALAWQRLFVLCTTLVALWLRLRALPDYRVTHWDEGLAFEGARWFQSLRSAGHYSPTYAPPLVPVLFACAMAVGGVGVKAAFVANAVLSALAVPMAWLVARRAFSAGCGLYAAALVAVSPMHVAYGSGLLTESAYVLFLLCSLHGSLRFLETRKCSALFATTLAVSALQLTKYNGCIAALPLSLVLLHECLRAAPPGAARRTSWLETVKLGALLAGPVLVIMALNLGAIAAFGDLSAFFAHYSGYVGVGAASLAEVHATRSWMYRHFAAAPATEWLGYAGLVCALLRHRERRAQLVHLAFWIYVLFLLRYTFYLRLLVPVETLLLLYAACLPAALVDGISRIPWTASGAWARRPNWLGWSSILPVLLLIAGVWRLGGPEQPKGQQFTFDGYERAARRIEQAPADQPKVFITQDHVWPMLEEGPAVGGPDSSRVRALLADGDGDVLLILDLAAWSRLRPWDLGEVADRLEAGGYLLERLPNPLGIDVLQNNMSLIELRSMGSGVATPRSQWLTAHAGSILIFRVPSQELASLLGEPSMLLKRGAQGAE